MSNGYFYGYVCIIKEYMTADILLALNVPHVYLNIFCIVISINICCDSSIKQDRYPGNAVKLKKFLSLHFLFLLVA